MAKYSVVLVFFMLISGNAQAEQSQRFITLGQFSNYRFTEEHQYGAEVDLLEEGKTVLGLFSYSQGLAGDTPTGLLENVIFDRASGKISFTAKLTMGWHYCNIHNNVPARDLFSFEGIINKSTISGKLKHVDGYHPNTTPTQENIVLMKTEDVDKIFSYRSRSEWEASMKRILKFRGPRWVATSPSNPAFKRAALKRSP
jgi:hypothetical protein